MDEISRIRITFYLSADEFDLENTTQKMGIVPTIARRKSDFPPTGLARTLWGIDLVEEDCIAVSILFKKLLKILESKQQTINAMCSEFGLKTSFEIAIHMNHPHHPEMVLTSDIVEFAASIGAEIGFDLYCYSEYDE